MLIVSGIEVNIQGSSLWKTPYILIAETAFDKSSVNVSITDTNTGKTFVVQMNNEQQLVQLMSKYSPYGFVSSKRHPATDEDRNYFVVIDDLSFRFLDFVDEVKIVRLSPSNSAYSALVKCDYKFDGIDSDNSILAHRSKGYIRDYDPPNVCTLLQAAVKAVAADCWVKGSCYLRASGEQVGDSAPIEAFEISFTNQMNALRFIRRAINRGYDMLEKYKDPNFLFGAE